MAAAPSTSAPLPPAPPCPAAAIPNAKQPAPPPAAVMDGEQPAPPPDYKGLNDKQQRAVTASLRVPLCVVAGAGSGKTSVLTNRIQFMLDSGVPPAKVLAVTFTTAAAGRCERLVACVAVPLPRRSPSPHFTRCPSPSATRTPIEGKGVDFSVWTQSSRSRQYGVRWKLQPSLPAMRAVQDPTVPEASTRRACSRACCVLRHVG